MKTMIIVCAMILLRAASIGIAWAGTEGNLNTFYGKGAGNNTTGDDDYDTFIGAKAGYSNTTGILNTFLGYYAGYANTTGAHNAFLGDGAGYAHTVGNENTFLGDGAGYANIKGIRNVFLGFTAGVNETGSNKLYIDNPPSTSADNLVIIGGGDKIGNAATQIDFYTAPNPTTPAGTARITIMGNGYVGIGTQKPKNPLQRAAGADTGAK